MSADILAATGNMLAKQRKREQEDSTFLFPKLGNSKMIGDTKLRQAIDDTYSRSSYAKDYDLKLNFQNIREKPTRKLSGRRNRPHPKKDWLLWHLPQKAIRTLTSTVDSGLWNLEKAEFDPELNKYETEYSRLYAGSPQRAYSERQRLLSREEVPKARLPACNEADIQPPPSPNMFFQNNPQFNNGSGDEKYSDLNKLLGSDIWKDKEVIREILETGDKRYLIKLLKTLSSETLLGLQKWLQASEEEKENEEDAEWVDTEAATKPPPTPMKDQTSSNADNESKTKKFKFSSLEGNKLIKNLVSSEDRSEIEQFLNNILKPEEITGVTHWLISREDREVALRFLGEVRLKPSKDSEKAWEILENGMPSPPPPPRRKKKRQSHGKNCSCVVCDADHSNRILRALYNQGSSSVIDEMRKALDFVPRPKKSLIRQQNHRKNQVPRLGGDNLMRRNVPRYIPNTKALFMQPHRVLPSYFVIHPELP